MTDRTITTLFQEMEEEVCKLMHGFMRCIQFDNSCHQTGHSCSEDESKCGCALELKVWCQKK